jgi:hypothetical protein
MRRKTGGQMRAASVLEIAEMGGQAGSTSELSCRRSTRTKRY